MIRPGDVVIEDGELLQALERREGLLRSVIEFVHAHPELGHEEHACSAHLADALAGAGLEIERGVGGMATAFRATLRGARPGRTIGIVALYDAVPAIAPDGSMVPTHSCGHGPIAGSVVAAAAALADLRDELARAVIVLGRPPDGLHAPGTAARRRGQRPPVEAG